MFRCPKLSRLVEKYDFEAYLSILPFIFMENKYLGHLNVGWQVEQFTIKGYFESFASPIPEQWHILAKITNI